MIHVRLAAVAVALTLLLVGCSDDDPTPAPPLTPSESTRTTPTRTPEPTDVPTLPTPPAALANEGAVGAEAFTIYFWQVVDYAQQTLDIDALRALTHDDCDGCQGALAFLQGVIDHDGRIQGGDGTVAILDTKQLFAGTRKSVSVTFDLTSTRQIVDAPGRKNDQIFPAATVRNRFVVDKLDGDWRVALWEVLG